jgi:hypothetical protein
MTTNTGALAMCDGSLGSGCAHAASRSIGGGLPSLAATNGIPRPVEARVLAHPQVADLTHLTPDGRITNDDHPPRLPVTPFGANRA